MAIKVTAHGAFFDVRQRIIMAEYMQAVMAEVARTGEQALAAYGNTFFRYEVKPRTGQWHGGVRTDIMATSRVIRDDVVYNSWLEGTSERNRSSKFKGYKLWRLTTQGLNQVKYVIAEKVLRSGFLERLNGI